MTNNTKKAPHPIDVTVGKNIKNRRNQLGLSQEKLGDALGVSFQQVQKYEKGTNRVSSSKLALISNVLSIDVAALFAGTELKDAPKQKILSRKAHKLAEQFDQIETPNLKNAVTSFVHEIKVLEQKQMGKADDNKRSAEIVPLKRA